MKSIFLLSFLLFCACASASSQVNNANCKCKGLPRVLTLHYGTPRTFTELIPEYNSTFFHKSSRSFHIDQYDFSTLNDYDVVAYDMQDGFVRLSDAKQDKIIQYLKSGNGGVYFAHGSIDLYKYKDEIYDFAGIKYDTSPAQPTVDVLAKNPLYKDHPLHSTFFQLPDSITISPCHSVYSLVTNGLQLFSLSTGAFPSGVVAKETPQSVGNARVVHSCQGHTAAWKGGDRQLMVNIFYWLARCSLTGCQKTSKTYIPPATSFF